MQRGDVFWSRTHYPPTGAAQAHMVILIRTPLPTEVEVPVVVCTTDKFPNRDVRPYELKFPKGHASCFKRPTVVDVRAPSVSVVSQLQGEGDPIYQLNTDEILLLDSAIIDAYELALPPSAQVIQISTR